MKLNNDIITTVGGAALAGMTAASPIINAIDGSFHQSDWLKLGMAIFFAIQGFFTNKKEKE